MIKLKLLLAITILCLEMSAYGQENIIYYELNPSKACEKDDGILKSKFENGKLTIYEYKKSIDVINTQNQKSAAEQKQVLSKTKQNDATWDETIDWINQNSKYIDFNAYKKKPVIINNLFYEYYNNGNFRTTDLLELECATLVTKNILCSNEGLYTVIELKLLGNFTSLKNEEDISIRNGYFTSIIISNKLMRERFLKAFQHLAYLREAVRKASGDKF